MASQSRAEENLSTVRLWAVLLLGTVSLLCAAVLASDAAELIHMYVELMNADASYTVIRDAIHIHPTLAEAIQSAVKSFK